MFAILFESWPVFPKQGGPNKVVQILWGRQDFCEHLYKSVLNYFHYLNRNRYLLTTKVMNEIFTKI